MLAISFSIKPGLSCKSIVTVLKLERFFPNTLTNFRYKIVSKRGLIRQYHDSVTPSFFEHSESFKKYPFFLYRLNFFSRNCGLR